MSDSRGEDVPYTGPPQNVPPPKGWQVPTVMVPHKPRELPPQDHNAIDSAETRARTLTQGLGILTASLLFVVLLVVFVRGLG